MVGTERRELLGLVSVKDPISRGYSRECRGGYSMSSISLMLVHSVSLSVYVCLCPCVSFTHTHK